MKVQAWACCTCLCVLVVGIPRDFGTCFGLFEGSGPLTQTLYPVSRTLTQVEGFAERNSPVFGRAAGEAWSYRREAYRQMAELLLRDRGRTTGQRAQAMHTQAGLGAGLGLGIGSRVRSGV